MIIYYTFSISDSTVTGATTSPFRTGLTPVISSLKTTGGTPGTDVSAHATIAEIGGGLYQIAYDAELYGEAAGIVDCTSALTVNSDRFLPIGLARDSSRIQSSLTSSGGASLSSAAMALIGPIQIVSGTLVPSSSADTYVWAGQYQGTRYYVGLTSGYYLWFNGTQWCLTSTAPGVSLPSAYFITTGSTPTPNGPWATGGTATGSPVVTSHGNSVFAAYQPELTPTATAIQNGVIVAAAGLDNIQIETGVNLRQSLSPILAASAGVLAGAGTGSIVIKGGNTSTTRIAATTDDNGNRTSVTLTLPS